MTRARRRQLRKSADPRVAMADTQMPLSRPMLQSPAAWSRGFLGPGIPVTPINQTEEPPVQFDYTPGINLQMIPRAGYGMLSFAVLRNFADLCEEVRIVIEAIKREIRSLTFDIQPESKAISGDFTEEIKRLRKFWKKPDGQTTFDGWINSLLEEILVVDAATLWIAKDRANIVKRVEIVAGDTIRPLMDNRGRTPIHPLPAYIQVRKGIPLNWYTSEAMLYRPFSTSTRSPYGRSPTEYVIVTINEAIRRKLAAMEYWDTTNIPEAMLGMPDTWTQEQIETFQMYFDAMLAGNLDKLRRLKMVPTQQGRLPIYEFRRPMPDAQLHEWTLKMAGWAFGFLPSEFGMVPGQGLGGRGFVEGQENVQYRFGIGPLIQYLEAIISEVVQMQTEAPLRGKFVDVGPSEDDMTRAQLRALQLQNGVIDLNVWRAEAGQPPVQGVKPFIVIGGQPIPLDQLFAGASQMMPGQPAPTGIEPPPPGTPVVGGTTPPEPTRAPTVSRPVPGAVPPGINTDTSVPYAGERVGKTDNRTGMALRKWMKKCERRVKDGKPQACEPPVEYREDVPESLRKVVIQNLTDGLPFRQVFDDALLTKASFSYGDIRAAFESRINKALERFFLKELQPAEFRNELFTAVNQAYPQAFVSGYRSRGGTEEAIPKKDWDYVNRLIEGRQGEFKYIENLWQDVRDREYRAHEEAIRNRVALYVGSLDECYSRGAMATLSDNDVLTFVLGPNEQHCSTCSGLSGKTAPLSWWRSSGLIPSENGNSKYECGGWQCKCKLIDSQGSPVTYAGY